MSAEVMYVVDRGEGPAVVLVPGLGADHRMYAPQLEALTEFRCLAVDLRGTGRSPSLHGVAVEDVLAVQADDIAAALDARGIERAHLVGISYGGPVSETFMLRHRDRIASAVICDSLCDTRPRTFAERLQMAGAKAQPAMLRALPPSWNAAMTRAVYARRWPQAADYLAGLFTRERLDDLVLQRRAVNAVQLEDRLRDCDVPTLCLVGDAVTQVVTMMRRVEAALRVTEFAVIPGSFDPSSLCRPDEFTAHVREWVTRHDVAA